MSNTSLRTVLKGAESNWLHSLQALATIRAKIGRQNPPHVKEALDTLFMICIEEEQDAWERFNEVWCAMKNPPTA